MYERESALVGAGLRRGWAIGVLVAAVATNAVPANAAPRSIVDRTLSCPVPNGGGVHGMYVTGQANQKPVPVVGGAGLQPSPSMLYVGVRLTPIVSLTGGKADYVLDEAFCTPATKISFGPAGLPLLGIFKVDDEKSVNRQCWIGERMLLRLRATLDAAGKPVAAKLAIRTGRGRPLAYVEWSPTRVRAFASRAFCHAGS